jgi:Zn-dependent M16 (insulinase) family peptidase
MDRLTSYFSNTGRYNELTRGLTYYRFVTGLVNEFDENSDVIIRNLLKTAGELFKKSNLQVAVTASTGDVKQFSEKIQLYTDALLEGESNSREYSFDFTTRNEGISSSSKVQYVVQGFDYKQLGYQYKGQMVVMNQVLSRDYLHEKIRVMGGAYGGFSGLSESGTFYFGSYRDPNLSESLGHYRNAGDFLQEFEADDTAMSRYIIGTMARYERPYTAQMKGESALENYYENIPEEQVQRIRQEILSTTVQDIRALAPLIREIIQQNYYCVFGNESKIQEAEDIFSRIVPARE